MSKEEVTTAFEGLLNIKNQEQNLPGLDSKMDPLAEHTKVEAWDNEGKPYLKEYVGSGKLEKKAAIITGGDSGIGRSVAHMFAREGCDVTIVYLPQEEKDAQNVKQAITSDPSCKSRKVLLIPADLMDAANCEKIVQKHMEEMGHLEVLVNNASKQMMCKALEDIDLESVESTFRSNILGMFALTKFALPHMKRGSTIVNSASVVAFKGSPAMMDYSSSKGAIITFTRSLALQLAPKGIRVNAVCPGPVYTPLQPASRPGEQMEDWTVGSVPLHGRAGMPSECGPSYVFCASSDSNIMTGALIHINNGQWIG